MPSLNFCIASIRFQLLLQKWNRCQKKRHLIIRYHSFSGTSSITTASALNQESKNRRIDQLQCSESSRGNHKDLLSWNSMITKYAKNGRIENARQLFDRMPIRDVVSWNAMIAGYVQNGRIENARQLFEIMPKRDVVSWTVMITGYGKNGRVSEAYNLFDKMPDRDVVSWTAMITAYAQNGRMDDARQLFDKMPKRNVVTWAAMIEGYLENGSLDDAIHLFDKMPERNSFSWNAMIAGYARHGRVEDASQLFENMPERNIVSWNTMIAGYAQNGRMDEARHLFDTMPRRNVVSWTAAITGYAQIGQMEDARHLFDKMPERDAVAWNAIIAGYAQNWQYEESVLLFSEMQRIGLRPNQSSFASVLSACTSLACLELGKQVHDHILKNGFESAVISGNALITMYAGCGSLGDAIHVFSKMTGRDVVSWTAMITGYAQHGCGKEALRLFKQMQLEGIKPDDITFIGVLFACSHAGLVDEGLDVFDAISRDHCITPTIEHYACMVDLLGRSGQVEEAEDFINRMPVKPSALVWRTLLGACGIHLNLDIGKRVAECLLELNPQNAGTYVLLSNIYAAAGRWDGVGMVRTLMKDRGVKKQPGYSWIEVNNKVHAFVVGDRSHPQTEKIYLMLDILARQMEAAGYVPNTNFVLHDMEQQQKEHNLSHL
eukprot:Gb_18840 [translate_table: standard]